MQGLKRLSGYLHVSGRSSAEPGHRACAQVKKREKSGSRPNTSSEGGGGGGGSSVDEAALGEGSSSDEDDGAIDGLEPEHEKVPCPDQGQQLTRPVSRVMGPSRRHRLCLACACCSCYVSATLLRVRVCVLCAQCRPAACRP